MYIYNKTSIKRNTGVLIKVLSPTRKETSYSDRRFWVSYILFIIIIGGILVLFIYKTRLASNEKFSPPNRIIREVGRARDLSAALYRGADKPDQDGNKLQRQKILSFIYSIYNHNWRNITSSTVYTYNKISIKRNILTIKQNMLGSRSG